MGQDNKGAPNFRQVAGAALPTANERWHALLRGERQVLLYSAHHQDPSEVARVSGTSTGFVVDTLKKIAIKSGPVRPQILSFITSVDLSEAECLTLCALKTEGMKTLPTKNAQIVECLASGYTVEEVCEELKLTESQYGAHKRSIVTHLDLPDESYIVPMAIAHHIRTRRTKNTPANGSAPEVTQ